MKRIICAALLSILIFTAGCGGHSAEPTPLPSVIISEPAVTSVAEEPTATVVPYYNPLSGEGMEADISENRPWAIMINNLDKALPQCGISEAEIIYEVPAEGGITRMMAIYTDISDVEAIGSMRSIRPYYADIGLSYNAIVVHAGGSVEAYNEMSAYDIDHLDGVLGSYASDTFYRDPSRSQYGIEHSMFTSGEKLISAAEGEGFDSLHKGGRYDYRLSFSVDAAKQCRDEAEYLKISFNGYKSTSFVFDSDTGLYTAYEYGDNYIDGNTNENMTFRNILVLKTSISVLDDVGRLSVKLTGTGDGYFICGGKYTEITWQRDENTSAFSYFLEDGTKLNLGIGTTYIGIMAKSGASVSFAK